MMFRSKKPKVKAKKNSDFSKHKQDPVSKKVTFIVDRAMKKIELIVLPMILRNNNLTDKTEIASFDELICEPFRMNSDVLIIRSSLAILHNEGEQANLKDAIRKFRAVNPSCVIFLFAVGYSANMQELKDQNIVDAVFHNNQAGDDLKIVAAALDMLASKQAE
jgi:hypothetical protein